MDKNTGKRERSKIKREILRLKGKGVPPDQVNKFLCNYYFKLTDYYAEAGKDRQWRSMVKSSYRLVQKIDRPVEEILALAKHYDYEKHRELSIKLLQPYIDKQSYTEDILFTYLFLTLPEQDISAFDVDILQLIDQAMQLNTFRFLEFFNPSESGALAVHLLSNETMRKLFCEHGGKVEKGLLVGVE